MKVLYGPDFEIREKTVVSIGKFDGLHKGHRLILNNLMKEAEENKLKSVVYTFLQNPRIILNHESFTPLMTNNEKTRELEKIGIDYLIYEDFSESFSKLLPEEFVKKVLVEKMNSKMVIMGANSTFGKDKSGNIEIMKELGIKYKFNVKCVDMLLNNGEVISSSRIRESILKGNY